MSVPTLCPRCRLGAVAVETTWWTTGARVHRSVWVDEPVRCGRGCPLTGPPLHRLLAAVYETKPRQLPLFAPEGPGVL